jgi:hypothetical protein
MRNASISAIVYEFLFEAYRKIQIDRDQKFPWRFVDKDGLQRELFFHEFMSCWEATDYMLECVGLMGKSDTAFDYPTVTLEQCSEIDFSDFETFDNYCIMMFNFWMLHNQWRLENRVGLEERSPRFITAMASHDDIFRVEGSQVIFDEDRYEQKVMARYRTLGESGNCYIHRKSEWDGS